jgi:hypothetical protein
VIGRLSANRLRRAQDRWAQPQPLGCSGWLGLERTSDCQHLARAVTYQWRLPQQYRAQVERAKPGDWVGVSYTKAGKIDLSLIKKPEPKE